jgi:hypothetical protein
MATDKDFKVKNGITAGSTGNTTVAVSTTTTTGVAGFQAQADSSTQFALFRQWGSAASNVNFGLTLAGYATLYTPIGATTSNGLIIGTSNAAPIVLGTNSTERARLLSDGSLILGGTVRDFEGLMEVKVSSGVAALDIFAASTAEAKIQLLNNNNSAAIGGGAGGELRFYASTRATERARIESSNGNFLVGMTTSSSSGIKIETSGGIRAQAIDASGTPAAFVSTGGMNMSYSGFGIGVLRAYTDGSGGSGVLTFRNNAGEMARFDASGNFGIGSAPSFKFDVQQTQNAATVMRVYNGSTGTSAATVFVSQTDAATMNVFSNSSGNTAGGVAALSGIQVTTNTPFGLWTNNTERLRITASGDVGIGTSSPGAKLQVQGTSGSLATFNGTSTTLTSQVAVYGGSSFLALVAIPQTATAYGVNTPGTSGLYVTTGANLSMMTDGVSGNFTWGSPNEIMRLTGTGNLGVGTSSPGQRIEASAAGDSGLRLRSTAAGVPKVWDLISGGGGNVSTGVFSLFNASSAVSVFTVFPVATEVIRIDSTGFVGIGTTAPATALHIVGTGNVLTVDTYTTNGLAPSILSRSARGTPASPAASNANDILGALLGAGHNGTTFTTNTAAILFYAESAFTATSNPTTMVFSTTGQNQTARAERMRIDSSGNLGISSTAPQARLHIGSGGAIFGQNYDYASVSQLISSADAVFGGGIIADPVNSAQLKFLQTSTNNSHYIALQLSEGIRFHTGLGGTAGTSVARTANERMRIDSAGNLRLGTTAQIAGTGEKFSVNVSSTGFGQFLQQSNNSGYGIGIQAQNNMNFYAAAGGQVGAISNNGTTTTYATTSDVRLKKNIVEASSAVEKVKALQVRAFDWKSDDSHVEHGFIAQELQTVEPLAVTEGETWAIDPSKLVATLTKALQEALARIEALEAKLL